MQYFCLPHATATWLLSRSSVLDVLLRNISDPDIRKKLGAVEFAEGPIRLLATTDSSLIVLWHVDYLSGTGEEDLGFIRLTGGYGVLESPQISREVFERCLYIINQRLEGLFIDGAYFHRSHANGAHTCAAGRGNEARQVNIGYGESNVSVSAASVKGVICVGPDRDLVRLAQEAADAVQQMRQLVAHANKQTGPMRRRQMAGQDFLADLRQSLAVFFQAVPQGDYSDVSVKTASSDWDTRDIYRSVGWTYSEWTARTSPLSSVQRRLLDSDPLSLHPIRIVGPGGSGKTLLMQLLAMRQLEFAKASNRPRRILYLTHNSKMSESVIHRFNHLKGDQCDFVDDERTITVTTLSDYARSELDMQSLQIIDPDAQEAKDYQAEMIEVALAETLQRSSELVNSSPMLSLVRDNIALQQTLVQFLMVEISTAIKGHGLVHDSRKYIQSERNLSRFHGALNSKEREFVFDVFRAYHNSIFEEHGVLDSDDIALSLLGRLRAPIWELKRRELGFDAVFVDETQLFNENERRLFSFLTKTTLPHLPIALALDEAQDVHGQTTAGMSSLGIEKIANENLGAIHRSTKPIVQLAFLVIQRSTDLFGPDFPDFTKIAEQMSEDARAAAEKPSIETASATHSLAKAVLKSIRTLRSKNMMRIGVICYSERYWTMLKGELSNAALPLRILEDRGERLGDGEPLVALSRPIHVGGQEFDAVILVGLEEGLVPPRIDNDALAAAVEQQMLRELYLGITRARIKVKVVLPYNGSLTKVLTDAKNAGLLVCEP